MITDDDLGSFGDAIRAKYGWEFMILDNERGLAFEWAVEAQLLESGAISSISESTHRTKMVLEYLRWV